jgi:hypothetical protein
MLCDLFGIAELTDQLFVPTTQEFNADINAKTTVGTLTVSKFFEMYRECLAMMLAPKIVLG